MFPPSMFTPCHWTPCYVGGTVPGIIGPTLPSAVLMFAPSMFSSSMFPPSMFPSGYTAEEPEPEPEPTTGVAGMFSGSMFAASMFSPAMFPRVFDTSYHPAALDFGATDVYRDIEARIEALGIFAEVNRNSWSGEHRFTPPVCVIRPLSETEVQTAGAPVVLDVTCTYQLIIIVAHEEERERFDWLRTLATKCQNVLNGVRLADRTRPQFTRLRGVRHDPRAEHPIGRATLDGTFLYEAGDRGRYEEF